MNNKTQIILIVFLFINILLSFNDYIKQKFNKKNKQKLNVLYTIGISIFISMLVYIFYECNDNLIIETNIAEF